MTGEYRWVLDSGTPRFAPNGAFLGYIGSCIDITERKRGEEKFRLVLDAAPNAMIMVDSVGVISFANAPAATVFGYSLQRVDRLQYRNIDSRTFSRSASRLSQRFSFRTQQPRHGSRARSFWPSKRRQRISS